MYWVIDKNTISELVVDGENLIHPWGVETADSSAFYSLEEGIGYRYNLLHHDVQVSKESFKVKQKVQLREGAFELFVHDTILNDRKIAREATLITTKPTYLMDFVLRFRFLKKQFSFATIAERTLSHKNTNIYYQYPVKKAELFGEKYLAHIKVNHCQAPEKMAPHLYVRDREDEWIVHARLLPVVWDKEVIKLCNPWAKTRPLPQILSRPFLTFSSLRQALWYRGERDPYKGKILRRVNPQAFPLVKLEKGETLSWNVTMEIIK